MAGKPAFHLFGFPIHVRPGFLMFMALVVFANGGELGLWIAGSAAVFTLLHELGHAFAARATGAKAEIALDFLAGYASFVPTRPLKRWERAGISIAGPATQIIISVAVLSMMGVSATDVDLGRDGAAALAIWWTGPVMGLFNLVPVLPLDGGHIVLAGLDAVLPGRSRMVMLWFSLVATIAGAVYLFTDSRYQGFAFFVIFPLMFQLQMLSARPGRKTSRKPSLGANAETAAWRDGQVVEMPEGLLPSPWFRAAQQLRQGDPDTACHVLVADFADPEPPNWWPPDDAPPETLLALVALLPRPLPRGRPYSELALARVLQRVGDHRDAARYAAEAFGTSRITALALVVASSAAVLGDSDTAINWLRAAYDADTDPDSLTLSMDQGAQFDGLRDDPRFEELRRRLDD